MYASKVEGVDRKGRSQGGWKDRVKEYLCEGGVRRGQALEQAKRECFG